jgi:hypothetical protein
LAIWTVLGNRIDDAALSHARSVYRAPQPARSTGRRRVRADETAPLWIGEFGKLATSLSALLVSDIDAEPVRFADVTAAVSATGDEIDWHNPRAPAAAHAVYNLWH